MNFPSTTIAPMTNRWVEVDSPQVPAPKPSVLVNVVLLIIGIFLFFIFLSAVYNCFATVPTPYYCLSFLF